MSFEDDPPPHTHLLAFPRLLSLGLGVNVQVKIDYTGIPSKELIARAVTEGQGISNRYERFWELLTTLISRQSYRKMSNSYDTK